MTHFLDLPVPGLEKIGWPWILNDTDTTTYDPSIEWPKISIVTPSFNQGRYIEETIRSVLLQNYPNLEYIIIDGGSTDETISIIKKYEKWIDCWVSEPDSGQSNAINKGLAKCTGEIFNWLNSDDSYTNGALFEVATAFMKDPTFLAVSGYENHFGEGKETYIYYGTEVKKTLAETIEFCEVSQPSTFLKLDAVKSISGVSEDLHCIMDGELWIKLLLLHGQCRLKKVQKILVNFRFHENSKTVNNVLVNNFLHERASIIADLQRFIGLPEKIINYYIDVVYASPKVYYLNKNWKFNNTIISKRKLRIYFVQKYVTKQFICKNSTSAIWGIKQLLKDNSFDFYLLKAFIKLLLKN